MGLVGRGLGGDDVCVVVYMCVCVCGVCVCVLW